MRALSVGDWEAAAKLGCLDLLEEDVALLSYLCTSGNDYSALLRQALDDFSEGL
jgi:Na+-transporting NADH:ubiquinone oxidoreductase subunit A